MWLSRMPVYHAQGLDINQLWLFTPVTLTGYGGDRIKNSSSKNLKPAWAT